MAGFEKLGLGGKPGDLLAFTGTLRTMPREINVGYVIAMPKFTRTLKAVGGSTSRRCETTKLVKWYSWVLVSDLCKTLLHKSSFHTKQQSCNPTEVGPGDVSRWADVLHMCKIQDDWHKAEENKVGAPNNAQKECSLSKFGTAQDHLEEHLRTNGEERHECTKSAPSWSAGILQRGRTCQLPAMLLAPGRCCLFITLGSTDSRAKETRAASKYSYLSHNPLDRDIAARGQQPNTHISHASVSCVLHFIISSCLLPPGYISRRQLVQDFLI